jgi:hypothetical protein
MMKKLAWSLGTVVAVAGLVLAVDIFREAMDWERYVVAVPQPRDLNQQAAALREKLEAYEKSADDLKTLASFVIGLSTLYGLVLGVSAYLGVQEATKRAEESVKDLGALRKKTEDQQAGYEQGLKDAHERFLAGLEQAKADAQRRMESELLDIRREFPLFSHMQRSILKIRFELEQLIPETDSKRDVYKNIQPIKRVRIVHYERTVAGFDLLDLEYFRQDASRIYRMLGSFYSAKYEHENSEKQAEPPSAPDLLDVERARFYLLRSTEHDPVDVVALNEIGYLEVVVSGEAERARDSLEKSLRLDPGQQRARYYLSIAEHTKASEFRRRGDSLKARQGYERSATLLTEALALKRWQTNEGPHHYRRSILYNLSCARACLAELESDPVATEKLRRDAVDYLKDAFLFDEELTDERKIRMKAFASDMEPGGDLYALLGTTPFGDEVKQIRQRVLGAPKGP